MASNNDLSPLTNVTFLWLTDGLPSISLRYDVMMIVIFLLGMWLINYIIALAGKANIAWGWADTAPVGAKSKDLDYDSQGDSEAVAADKGLADKELAEAALDIIKGKTAAKSSADPIARFNQEIIDNAESVGADPVAVLNRMGKMGVCPAVSTYNHLLNACILTKNFEKAYLLFMDMREPGCVVLPDVITYNIYMKGIGEAVKAGESARTEMVQDLLAEMQARGVRPDSVTFNTILDLYATGGNGAGVWEYLEKMRQCGVSPDDYTFSIVLKHVRKAGKPLQYHAFMDQLFKYIESHAGTVDEILLHNVIDVCGRFAEYDRLDQLRSLLSRNKRTFSLAGYGELMATYGQQGNCDRVMEVYSELKSANLHPNEVTFGCVLEACLHCGRTDRAIEVYQDMKKVGPSAFNVVVYTSLLRVFSRAHNFPMVYDIYLQMRGSPDVTPNLVAYNAMLDCCVKCKKCEVMELVFADMCARVAPDLISYSTLVKGLCDSGHVEKALALYDRIKAGGTEFDAVFFNTLLDGVSTRSDSVVLARGLLRDMDARRISPTASTYSTLLKLYGKARDLEHTFEVYNEMIFRGMGPGIELCTWIMQTCVRSGRADKAIWVFGEMRARGLTPDRAAYNTIVGGCCQSKRFEACGILCEAASKGIRLADELYSTTIRLVLDSASTISVWDKCRLVGTMYGYAMTGHIKLDTDVLQGVGTLQAYCLSCGLYFGDCVQ